MKLKSLFLGFLAGGIAAGVTSLLTAPAPGKETQANFKRYKDHLIRDMQDVQQHLSEIKGALTHLSAEGKEGVLTFIEEIKILIKKWKLEIKPHQEQLQAELNSIQNTIKELQSDLEVTP